MAAYDPKRPRPTASTPADEPAPVEALLEPAEAPTPSRDLASAEPVSVEAGSVEPGSVEAGSVEPESVEPESVEPESVQPESVERAKVESAPTAAPSAPIDGTSLNGSARNGSASTEVPVAPAPETGTANRAVLIAALVSSAVVGLIALVLLRRRRGND